MRFQIMVAGTSLGGFHALKTVLHGLPKDFALPVVVVQHRSFEESEPFAPLLAAYVSLPVVEIDDKQEIKAGQIFVGPSNYHVLIDGNHLRSEEHTSELQSLTNLVCRLLLEKK